jgi:D-3-phosphoglycerate dehydrogenase / 2-oxoglutarate reductase
MKVLVSDNLGDIGIRIFEAADGIEVDVKTGLSPEELKAIIGQYDALVIRSATKVTADLIAAADRLKVVGRAGIGLDNVDIPAATQRGIVVMNTPTGNIVTTAEHAVAMMLALSRNIPRGTSSLKAGQWQKKQLQGREIFNKTLGVIGFGKIGAIVADRARGLKMRVVVHDPHVTAEHIQKAGFEAATLDELYARSDYITIHVPKTKDTAGMLDAGAFARMKDGVMVINCARGGIVNEADLHEAMKSGKVAGAALDVFETEPPENSPLFELDNFICTPHLGASTAEAQTNVAKAVAEQIVDYLTTGTVVNAVNVPSVTGEELRKLSPYLTLGDRMGCLLAQICTEPVSAIDIQYLGDFRDLDLAPVTVSVIQGLLAPMIGEMVNSVNAPAIAKDRGIKVSESRKSDAEDYLQLIRVQVNCGDGARIIDGTVFGKSDPRIVKINNFRLEMTPEGHAAIIHNLDKPGAIGSIGVTLGENGVNISQMQVGQEIGGEHNIIFLVTDTPIPTAVVEQLRALPLVESVTPLEL